MAAFADAQQYKKSMKDPSRRDVFYVEQAGGGKVRDPERLMRLPLVLRETIAKLDVEGA